VLNWLVSQSSIALLVPFSFDRLKNSSIVQDYTKTWLIHCKLSSFCVCFFGKKWDYTIKKTRGLRKLIGDNDDDEWWIRRNSVSSFVPNFCPLRIYNMAVSAWYLTSPLYIFCSFPRNYPVRIVYASPSRSKLLDNNASRIDTVLYERNEILEFTNSVIIND